MHGEDYLSVIDPETFKETRRIKTAVGPGMVQFKPDGKPGFAVASFTPEVDVTVVRSHKVIQKISVVSPFSPFLQFTPEHKEMWMTHKDVGEVTRIDTLTLKVSGVIDTGFITNHLAFATVNAQVLAYVPIGGEDVVKVYTSDADAKLVATIPTGALPHGIWTSDDSSRVDVGLENGDGMDVIDPAQNKVIAHTAGGQSPRPLVFLSNVIKDGDGKQNLSPPINSVPRNIRLKPVTAADARGFVVSRNLGVVDALKASLFKLKPQTNDNVYLSGVTTPVASFVTDAKGISNGTAIGPTRNLAPPGATAAASRLIVMEGNAPAEKAKAALVSDM